MTSACFLTPELSHCRLAFHAVVASLLKAVGLDSRATLTRGLSDGSRAARPARAEANLEQYTTKNMSRRFADGMIKASAT